MGTRFSITALVFSLSFSPPKAIAEDLKTADEVIARYVAALGGANTLAARRSLRMSGKGVTPGAGEARWVSEWKKQDLYRVESTPAESRVSIVYAFDGRTWWHVMPMLGGEPQEMPADLAALMAAQVDADGPLVDYAEKGHRVELLGREDVGGRPAYKLRVVLRGSADGESDDYFIDAQSFLLVKIKGRHVVRGETVESEATMSDYRPVDGLLVAHTIRQRDCVTGVESTSIVENVEINVDIPDDRFSLAAARAEHARRKPPEPTSAPAVENDPAARALYDGMVAALRAAQSLTVTCKHRWESGGMPMGRCTYRLWLKKPNHFRMETAAADGEARGVIVGDGENLWIYWPQGRPRFDNEALDAYRRTRENVYFSEPAPPGRHSISHRAMLLGAGLAMTILNPSTFHGYTDSLQPHLDGVAGRGVEPVGGEACDVIELSFMNGQRTWKLWLSQRDHLPRRLHEVVRVSTEIVKEEEWTDVAVDGDVPADRFVWQPPADWKQWYLPEVQDELLKPGTPAPDFEAALANGQRVKLSGLRGKVVLLVFWRVGCPPCREELPYLQKLHEQYAAQGLAVLGFDAFDRLDIVDDLMKKQGLTFPCIVDSSQAALLMAMETYKSRAVPTSYLIDREGGIVAAWVGFDPQSDVLAGHLRTLGIGK